MNTKSIALIASVLFVSAIVGGYFWLWQLSKNYNPNPKMPDNLSMIEIETVKNDAENILNGLEKNSDIPVPMPSDKMGKANPFTAN